MAVTVAYGPLLGGFAGELLAFKTEFNAFGVSTVADLAELVFSCHAPDVAVGAGAFLHFGTFLACYAANANSHLDTSTMKRTIHLISVTNQNFLGLGNLYLPSLANRLLEKPMFCPYCGRQNKDTAVFCEFCGKALSQKNSSVPTPTVQPVAKANQGFQVDEPPKPRLSYNAKRGIITGLLVIVLVLVVLVIYYPNLFHL